MMDNEKIFDMVKNSFRQILDNINDPLIIINKDGIVIYVNEAYEHQVGTSRELVLGRNLHDKYPDDKLLLTLKTGQFIENEEHYNKTLGYTIVASFLPLNDQNNQTIGVIGIGTTRSIYKLNKYLSSSRNNKNDLYRFNRNNLKHFDNIISEDPKFLYCLGLTANVAKTEATIMLRGETGVGKEVIAKAIHDTSNRADSPFVTINSSSIPENLLESELFGYESGSFTGALSSGKIGKIEQANFGTLFLDEIGDISLSTQVKLLRFTQERYIERIGGGNKKIPINVRIVTATNRNLEQMVQQGEFREDLYYRLNVVPIFIPPLRERYADIPILANFFLDYFLQKYGKTLTFSHDTMECLQDYHWPGNVRELKNVIEHAVIMCQGDLIKPDNLQITTKNNSDKSDLNNLCLNTAVENVEKYVIKRALAKAQHNKSKAIKLLGISRSAFYAKLKKYDLII